VSFADMLTHPLLIAHPDPATSADSTGQLFVDATGQPVGDATIDQLSDLTDWSQATQVRARIEERSARWPNGPGAGAELVDTKIWVENGTEVRELDKVRRDDTGQAYQVVFVDPIPAGRGVPGHIRLQARRIPL
jgi:hypothetical protein